MAAVRRAAEGGEGEVFPDAREQLRRVLTSWDHEAQRVLHGSGVPPTTPAHPAAPRPPNRDPAAT